MAADSVRAAPSPGPTRGLLIAATGSGRGKTSVTLGLLGALARRGLRLAPFKTGPDFIDPGLHALACGAPSENLDSWMLSDHVNRTLFARSAQGADLALIEGAMGLFDGLDGADERGSAAHMAKLLGVGVVLVVDVSGMARSVAALVEGFARFDPDLPLAGLLLNRVGGPGHRDILRKALDRPGLPPLLGLLPRDPAIALPARHLGLVTAEDLTGTRSLLARLADWVEAHADLDALLGAAPPLTATLTQTESEDAFLPEADIRASSADSPIASACLPPTTQAHRQYLPPHAAGVAASASPAISPAVAAGPVCAVRLGVARDRAFSFCYPENLRLLQAAGAEVVFFSPLDDPALPPELDGLYLPGGYPELHGPRLAANTGLLAALAALCASGRPVYAECGGFLLLMHGFHDASGEFFPMAGVFDCQARLGERFAALGYRQVRFTAATPLGPDGTVARGHEFHYSTFDAPPGPGLYARTGRVGDLDGADGFVCGQTLAAYTHLHFASNPALSANFVAAMRTARARCAS